MAEQSGWRAGKPREAQVFAGASGTPGVAAADGCGDVSGPERRGGGGFGLPLGAGSPGAPCPGCAGAPSQFESAGGVSSPAARHRRAARSEPAAGVRPSAASAAAGAPPAAAARPAPGLSPFLSLLLGSPSHRHLLASTPSCDPQSCPDSRASRCQEVRRGARGDGSRACEPQPLPPPAGREKEPRAPRAAPQPRQAAPVQGDLAGSPPAASPRLPPGRGTPLGGIGPKPRRRRAAG